MAWDLLCKRIPGLVNIKGSRPAPETVSQSEKTSFRTDDAKRGRSGIQ